MDVRSIPKIVLYENSKPDEALFRKAVQEIDQSIAVCVVRNKEELNAMVPNLPIISCFIVASRTVGKDVKEVLNLIGSIHSEVKPSVVLFGGSGRKEDCRFVEMNQVNLHVTKPLNPDDFIDAVKRILSHCVENHRG